MSAPGEPPPRGEFARIGTLLAGLPRGEGVVVGPGDDAAVLRPRDDRDLVVTTDTFVERRHFRRDLLEAAEAGGRFAAANLSDIAAMAALPRWATMSLVVPADWSEDAARAFEHACAETLAADGAAVVGGNLASTEGAFSATLTLVGEVERGLAWTRAGARAGDVLAVTGVPGSAAAFLALALSNDPPSRARVPDALIKRFLRPGSRVGLARALAAAGGVRAAIDVSDGLSGDLAHVCLASGVGACIDAAKLPADEPLLAATRRLSAGEGDERGALPAAELALRTNLQLGPSDDYELLLAIEPGAWPRCATIAEAQGVKLTAFGEFETAPGLRLRGHDGSVRPLMARGWDHFAS